MADVLKTLAEAANKPRNQYRYQEFENADGGYSVAIVDNESGSITLQANSGSAGDAKKRLEEAVEAGNYTFLDPAIPPKTETREVPEAKTDVDDTDESKRDAAKQNAERAQVTRENAQTRQEAGLVTNGYAVLDDERQGVGETGTSTATADRRGVEKQAGTESDQTETRQARQTAQAKETAQTKESQQQAREAKETTETKESKEAK